MDKLDHTGGEKGVAFLYASVLPVLNICQLAAMQLHYFSSQSCQKSSRHVLFSLMFSQNH